MAADELDQLKHANLRLAIEDDLELLVGVIQRPPGRVVQLVLTKIFPEILDHANLRDNRSLCTGDAVASWLMARRKASPRQPFGNGAENHGLPELAPDLAEQERGDLFDAAIPISGLTLFVIGLGGSAGSLPALQAFFSAMPADNGMAFVVIMHLSPAYESILAEVLQRVIEARKTGPD